MSANYIRHIRFIARLLREMHYYRITENIFNKWEPNTQTTPVFLNCLNQVNWNFLYSTNPDIDELALFLVNTTDILGLSLVKVNNSKYSTIKWFNLEHAKIICTTNIDYTIHRMIYRNTRMKYEQIFDWIIKC